MPELPNDPGWLIYRQRLDDSQMRALVILHRIYAGIVLVSSCFYAGYLVLATVIFSSPRLQPPTEGYFDFQAVGAQTKALTIVIIAVIWLWATLNLICAGWLKERRMLAGVFVVTAINLLSFPMGTALAIFTWITVNRQDIRPTFR